MDVRTPDQRSIFQKILDLYVYSSFHIGLCAFALTLFGFLSIGQPINLIYCLNVGFATIALYSIHRLVGISKVSSFEHQGRFQIIKKYKNHIWVYFSISSLISFWTFWQLELSIQIVLVIIGLISISYSLPIFKGKRLRDFNYIKIILIAIVWSVLCFVIPAYMSRNLDYSDGYIFMASVLFFIGITLPFDIRDIEADKSMNVKTIPILIGVNQSMSLSKYALLLAMTTILLYIVQFGYSLGIVSWMMTLGVAYLFVRNYRKTYTDWYCSILLDGTIGVFFITFTIFNILYNFI